MIILDELGIELTAEAHECSASPVTVIDAIQVEEYEKESDL